MLMVKQSVIVDYPLKWMRLLAESEAPEVLDFP